MISLEQQMFNLVLNGVFSFIPGLAVAFLAVSFFRIGNSRWKLFLLSLPFVKIIWDLLKGIPESSFLHAAIDPLALPPKHSLLQAGLGASEFGPIFDVSVSVLGPSGKEFSISVPDYLNLLLVKYGSPHVPAVVLGVLLAVASFLLIKRAVSYFRFESTRRLDRNSSRSTTLSTALIGRRTVDIYESKSYSGSPFTGGVLNPFICIPYSAVTELTPSELDAVVKHEISHIRCYDLVISIFIAVLGDLFWFVPGYRFLGKRMDRMREILADRSAVESGASPEALASALIKLKEVELNRETSILYSAFVRERSLLKTRIAYLQNGFAEHKPPRFGWNNRWIRWPLGFWAAGAVLRATFGGNHAVQKFPDWIESFLKSMGLI